MNLRQKERTNFCALAGLKNRKNDSAKRRDDDLNSGMNPYVNLTRFNLSRTVPSFNPQVNSKHLESHMTCRRTTNQVDLDNSGNAKRDNKSIPCKKLSDPKLYMPCKVHILRCDLGQEHKAHHQSHKNQNGDSESGNIDRQNSNRLPKYNNKGRSESTRPSAMSDSSIEPNQSQIKNRVAVKNKIPNTDKLTIADPKLKLPCKVHIVRLTFNQNCHMLTTKEANRYLPTSNAIYKVSVKQKKQPVKKKSRQQKNMTSTNDGLSVNQSMEIGNLNEEIELACTKQADVNTMRKPITFDGPIRKAGKTISQSNQISVHASCHADCDHLNVVKDNEFNGDHVDIINNNNKRNNEKEAEEKEPKKTVSRKKNMTQKLPLKDQNEIIPRKKTAKKKVAAKLASENIPEVVVEKCTDRVPVYKKNEEDSCITMTRKSNPFEFNELDSSANNTTKPLVKKRRKVGVRTKKQNTKKLVYDQRIKQIMNKLAITIQSNKFVAKEVKSSKSKNVFATKNIRIQTKKVQFDDQIIPKEADSNGVKATNHKMNNLSKVDNKINTYVSNKVKETALENKNVNKALNNIRNIELNNEDKKFNNGNIKVISNHLLDNKAIQRKYVNQKCLQRAMNPKRLFDQSIQDASTSSKPEGQENTSTRCPEIFNKQRSEDKNANSRPGSACSVTSGDMFDFCDGHDDGPSTSTAKNIKHSTPWCISSERNQAKERELCEKNALHNDEDLDMNFASQISINRSPSACSEKTSEHSHSNSVEFIAEDDPYFGFGDDEVQGVQQSQEILTTTKPLIQHHRKRLPALESTRKTDSPWRYSPRNISFNPHFIRLNAKALPVINQDPVLDSTFDENIKKHHPNLTAVESPGTPQKRSPVQKSILDYVTSNVVASKENVQRVSIFNEEEFSPIKLTNNDSVPKNVNASKAKRNILGPLTDNIIIHSVAISTPQKDKHANKIESPDLSVIFDDVKNDHALLKTATTKFQTLQKGGDVLMSSVNQEDVTVRQMEADIGSVKEPMEVIVTQTTNNEDVCRGFSMNHIETSKNVSSRLEEFVVKRQEILSEQQSQMQFNKTLFGFESIMNDDNMENKGKEIHDKEQKTNQDAKPFRLSLGVRKFTRKKGSPDNKQGAEEPLVEKTPEMEAAESDSEEDFVPPTPVPENEPLKVGLFEEIETKQPKKTYRSRKRYRVMAADDSDEEDVDKHKKKKKDQPTKEDVEQFDKWAQEFNAMCEEVENFPLEIE